MSKEKRKARALASSLELSRKENRKTAKGGTKRLSPEPLTTTQKRLKAETLAGTNVPARIVERMGTVGVSGVRTSDGNDVAKLRPKRKARTVGGEAAAAGLVGRGYASKSDGITRLTDDQIRANRDRAFSDAVRSRKARKRDAVAPDESGARRIARAREEYAHAIGQARARSAAGDASGAEAWMTEARKARRIFRNK